MTREHELKCWPEFFGPVSGGEKTFELRRDDRDPPYMTADVLRLREWLPADATYTGRECRKRVTYTLGAASHLGLAPGHVIMGLADVPDRPGANPLDTPEVREAVAEAIADADGVDIGPRDAANAAVDVLVVLAPHVAAAQRAAFRAGVEMSAGVSTLPSGTFKPALKAKGLDDDMADLLGGTLDTALGLVADTIRAIPTPAEFAVPESDGECVP